MRPIPASFVKPLIIGVAAGAVIQKLAKPALRKGIKAGMGLAAEARRMAAEAGEELQDITAEAYADLAGDAAETRNSVGLPDLVSNGRSRG